VPNTRLLSALGHADDRVARPAHATTWLLEDARRHVADKLVSPALDCADLAEQLRMNADAAYAELARLDLVQLTLQAVCYAAYANELLGLDLSGDDVLGFWGVALARRGQGGCVSCKEHV